MSLEKICEISGCPNQATRIAGTGTSYVVVCENCWHDKYRK